MKVFKKYYPPGDIVCLLLWKFSTINIIKSNQIFNNCITDILHHLCFIATRKLSL